MSKRSKIIAFTFVLLLVSTYIGLWLYSAQWFTREIDKLYANAQEEGVEFLGPKPKLTNFPFVPTVLYNGGLKFGNTELLFPQMILRGYPVPYTTLHLSFPLGISLGGIVDPRVWSLDQLDARLEIPYQLPAAFTQEDLQDWRAHGGKIDVRHYTLRKETLNSEGKGFFALDEKLQPVFEMQSTVKGYDVFIRDKKDAGLIDPFGAAVAITMLNGLAKQDEKTGEMIVHLNASVKNRLLSVGILQVLELPEIVWDTRTPPVPHQ
jgi:hypothetical protein